jgi:general secretion pathway protein M
MIAALDNWWQGLSPRERWLVGIAGGLTAIVVGWFLIYLPLNRALADAQDRLGQAIDRRAAVAARVAAVRQAQAGGGTGDNAPADSAPLDLRLAQSAAEAGFTLARNEAQGGRATIAIANARARAVMAWLDTLQQSGLLLDDLTLRPNADGTVALTATLRPGRPGA